jgi:sulfite reductase (NADPH) flavoprotein alpha-component
MDEGDAGALARWRQHLGTAFGRVLEGLAPASEAPWIEAPLQSRKLLNPGSQGEPLYEVALTLPRTASWAPGMLVEVLPGGERGAADEVPRRYSVASLPADGTLQLLVRQQRRTDGSLGLASGWLTTHAEPGTAIRLRLVDNTAFALVDDDRPCIFIGNGSGFAGLRAHLRERARRGHGRNWLVFGERQSAHDAFFAPELQTWQAQRLMARADIAWSRDLPQSRYVQQALAEAADAVRSWIDDGAVVYVCGSLQGMAPGVDAALRTVLGDAGLDALSASGRYRRDVY